MYYDSKGAVYVVGSDDSVSSSPVGDSATNSGSSAQVVPSFQQKCAEFILVQDKGNLKLITLEFNSKTTSKFLQTSKSDFFYCLF